MLRILNTNRPIILFFLPIYSLLLLLPVFWTQSEVESDAYMPLYLLFDGIFSHQIAKNILTVVVILAGAYSLNFVVNKHNLLNKNTNISASVYVILLSLFSSKFGMHPILFANVVLIWVLDSALTLYNQNKVYNYCFRVGFLIAIASLFYVYSLFFILEFLAALLIIRTFDWRDWVITFLGLLVPFFYAWTYFFWFDELPIFFNAFAALWSIQESLINLESWRVICFTVLLALGVFATLSKVGKENVRQKNLLYLILTYQVIAIIIKLLMGTNWLEAVLLSIPAVGIMISILLQNLGRRWVSETLIILLLVVVFSNHWELLS